MMSAPLALGLIACAPRITPPTPTEAAETVDLYEPAPDVVTPPPEDAPGPTPAIGEVTPVPTLEATPSNCPDSSSTARTVLPAQRLDLPILMYHHVRALPAKASPIWRGLTVAPDAFEQQVAYLASHSYHTIAFSELVAYFRDGRPLPSKPIILTFDDAWRDDYTVVFPALRRNCLIGTFFPPINWIGTSPSTLTWPQIEEMSAGGMEIGSHTLNHHLLAFETEAQVREQLLNSRLILEEHLHKPVVVLAYPGGSFNARVLELVPEEGYGAAVTTMGGLTQSANQIFTLRRVSIRYADDLAAFIGKITPAR